MYVYFDKNGNLKEFINDSKREGSQNVNKIYFYIEPSEETIEEKTVNGQLVKVLMCLALYPYGTADFRLKDLIENITDNNGNILNSLTFNLEEDSVYEQIPYDKERDLKYFKYGYYYQFIKLNIPTEALVEAGMVDCSISMIDPESSPESQFTFVLDTISFFVQNSVVLKNIEISVPQYQYLLTTKIGIASQSILVFELPEEGQANIFYVVKENSIYNIYIWNGSNYVWVGDNSLYLGNYYTKQEGNKFEEEVDNRVTSVENELSSVASGSPSGIYATVSALTSAHPTGDNKIYLVSADGHWYYWNGSAWTNGGVYLSTGNAVPNTRKIADYTLENDISKDNLFNALNLKEICDKTSMFEPLMIKNNYHIDLTGESVSDATSGDKYQCCSCECKTGDIFVICGAGTGTYRLYAFADANKDIISVADANKIIENGVLVAPTNAAYFYANNYYSPSWDYNYRYQLFVAKGQLNTRNNYLAFAELVANKDLLEITNNAYWNLSGDTVNLASPSSAQSYNRCCKVACSQGDTFLIIGYGSSATRLYAFTDSSGNILMKAPANTLNAFIVAPQGSAYFLSNCYSYTYNGDYICIKNFDIFSQTKSFREGIAAKENMVLLLPKIATEDDLIYPGLLKSTDGTIYSVGNQNWTVTDYIKVNENTLILVIMSYLANAVDDVGLAFYDENKTFISGINFRASQDYSNTYYELETITPSNARYIRTCMRNTVKSNFYIKSYAECEPANDQDTNEPTPILFSLVNPTTPSTGISNKAVVDKNIDCDDIMISANVSVNTSSILFMGSVDILGQQHASHVQYDFSLSKIRIYEKGTGNSIPSNVLATIDFSSLGTITNAIITIGRKNRQLYVSVENYKNGNIVEYTVDEETLSNYAFPAGWLNDKFAYGIISGTATYNNITAATIVSPYIAFIGDSITEGYGIPYDKCWAYIAGQSFPSFLGMGRSGGKIDTAQGQVKDIISKIKPKYTVVCIGTNGGNTENNLKHLLKDIRKYGSQPIICRIPMCGNGYADVSSINSLIASLKEITVGFDYATSTNNDLTNQNISLFQGDLIHPNQNGAYIMSLRFLEDISFIKKLVKLL